MGRITYAEVAGVVAKSLGGLIPKNNLGNRFETGLSPLKLYETLSCGVPAIVSDFPGQADLIRNNKCGIVIPPEDPKSLAEAVAFIYNNPREAQKMGKRGRQIVEREHSWKQRAKDTAETNIESGNDAHLYSAYISYNIKRYFAKVMSKEIHIYTCALILVFLIGYSFFKWIVRGKLFHPGLIYAVINSLFFITFAFGPYKYNVRIDNSYYYMYAFITIAFTVGIVLGESCKSRKVVKDISLKNKAQFFLLYFINLTPTFLVLINLAILTNFNLEKAAAERINLVNKSLVEVNLGQFFIGTLITSISQILSPIVITYAIKQKKYIPIALWLIMIIGVALLGNSRTGLVVNFLVLIISSYTVIQTNYKKNYLKILNLEKILFLLKKNKWRIFLYIIIIIFVIMIVTNTRNQARSAIRGDAGDQNQIIIEQLYRAEKKQWFQSWLAKAPVFSVDTIVELSLYAGGTVASGGVITRIATDTGLYTWGLRNFFVFHRVLAQLRLDGGFSNNCRENYYTVQARAIQEVPAILTGWFGDPGNLLLDFGYVGAPVASLITGWLVGWLYGSLCNSGFVIKATATSVFATAMLLTPAGNVFSVLLSNSLNFFVLLLYLLTQKSVPKNIWSSSYNNSTKYQTLRRYRFK